MGERYMLEEQLMRHNVSDKMLRGLKEVSYAQDDFGIRKYNKALNHFMDYDWLKMLQEELADGLKYLQCEMDRKELVIAHLHYAIEAKDWSYVKLALDNLSKSGTGK